jgi:hypothetical protein
MRVYPPTLDKAYLLDPTREARQRRRGKFRATFYSARGRAGRPAAPDIAFHRDTIVLMKDMEHFWCTRPDDAHNAGQLMESYRQRGGSVWRYEQHM